MPALLTRPMRLSFFSASTDATVAAYIDGRVRCRCACCEHVVCVCVLCVWNGIKSKHKGRRDGETMVENAVSSGSL